MFNIGPLELVVLAFVALIVVGPEKLPGHARDAARLIKSLRDMANGARGQFREELGPELADLNLDALRELRALNPKSALMKALFDDTDRAAEDGAVTGTNAQVNLEKQASAPPIPPQTWGQSPAPERPLAPGETSPFDADAT